MAKRSIPKASLDAAAMKRRAASIFVDREEPKAIYAAAIQELHERENVHFLSFYGVGGQGKSALYRELQRISSLPPYSEQDICVAALDLRLNKPIDNLQCWVMLRNAIAKVTGCRFPCFDFVYADYMKTAHDHVPPCLLGASRLIGFGGSNGDTANETASEGVQAGIEGAGKSLADSLPELLAESVGTVPVFGPLIKRGLKSATVKGYEVWLKRNKIALEHLYPTTRVPTVDELKEALPRILAHELALHQGREKYLSQRLVIMVDEYENAMPGGGSENIDDSYKAGSWDSGLRDFITFCQGIEYRAADPEEEDALYSADVLLILFGREKINWARIERHWENLLCPEGAEHQHLLEGLSKKDADDFLVQAQVDEPDIRHAIIETAQAFDKTSGRHAVYPIMLDLAVQIYFDLKSKNLPVNPDEFSVSGNDYIEKRRDLLGRLLRNYDVPIREMLKRLACTREFDRELTAFLAEKHARAFNMSSFTVLTRLSFVSRVEDSDQWTLHQHISDTLLEGLKEIDRQETYKSLFDFYDGRSKAPSTSEVTLHHARALGLRYIYSALAQIPGDVRPKLDAAQEIAFGYPGAQEWLKQCFLEMRDILCITLPPEHPDIADSLLGLGIVFSEQRDFDAARTAYEEALEIRRAALPPEHPDIADSLLGLGNVFYHLRDFDVARTAYEEALEIRRAALPPEHPEIATSLNNLGIVFSERRDFDAARTAYEEALEIRRAALPPEHPDIATSLNNLGNVFFYLRDFDAARTAYEEALEIRRAALPPEHPDIATSLNNLGIVFSERRDFDVARAVYEEALEIRRAALPPEHPEIAASLNNLGTVFFGLRDFDAARAAYEEALEIRRAALPPEHPDIARSINNLGIVFSERRDYDTALTAYEEALEIRRAALPPEHPDIATSLNNLGNVFFYLRDFDAARTAYEEALEIRRAALPPEHPDIATSLNNLGIVFSERRDFDAARTAYEEALEIRRAALPPEHPEIADSLNNLGNVFSDLRDFDAARTAYEEALEIRRAALPPEHSDIADSLNNLGNVFSDLRDFDVARTAYEEALEIKRAALPPEHPDIATSLNNLGIVFSERRDFDVARAAYEEALEIQRAALPPKHPDIATSLNNLGTVFFGLRDFDAARAAYEEALQIRRAALPPDHPHIAVSLKNLKIVERAEEARDNAWTPQSTPQPMGDDKPHILPQTPEPWPLPILWPGAWEELGNDQAEPIIRALDEEYIQGEEQGGHRFCAAYNLQRLRWADLPFFNDSYKLIEGCTFINKKAASFIGIWDGAKVHIGLGEADLIHTINRTDGINLASDAHRLAYLRFFCSWVRAEKGRFTWIESADCLTPFVGSATDRQALMTKTIALEIAPEPNANGAWEAAATIVYGSDLFRSTFLLKPDGTVEMPDDKRIPTPDGLIHAEKWEGPFRSAGYA